MRVGDALERYIETTTTHYLIRLAWKCRSLRKARQAIADEQQHIIESLNCISVNVETKSTHFDKNDVQIRTHANLSFTPSTQAIIANSTDMKHW